MDIDRFKKFIKELKDSFIFSKDIIEDAIKKELEYGHIISFEDIMQEINRTEEKVINYKEKRKFEQKIAIIYKGVPEITLNTIITSIYYNDRIYLYSESYDVIESAIIELVNKVLENLNIKEKPIIFKENTIEDLIYNQKLFDEIIYIGDYFEYNNVKYYVSENITYNPYGFIKVYINKINYKEEYKELMKCSYKRNISIEYYEDINDFIQNVKDTDDIVIYENKNITEEILGKINPRKLYTHEEFINNYKFSYL